MSIHPCLCSAIPRNAWLNLKQIIAFLFEAYYTTCILLISKHVSKHQTFSTSVAGLLKNIFYFDTELSWSWWPAWTTRCFSHPQEALNFLLCNAAQDPSCQTWKSLWAFFCKSWKSPAGAFSCRTARKWMNIPQAMWTGTASLKAIGLRRPSGKMSQSWHRRARNNLASECKWWKNWGTYHVLHNSMPDNFTYLVLISGQWRTQC